MPLFTVRSAIKKPGRDMRLNLDVLLILEALDKHGSFAAAAESLFKTPAALSYMVQKLESDLKITLLDRSGHRAKFTDTGRLLLEQGSLLLDNARALEKQAVQLACGWEKELMITLDRSLPFTTLLPTVEKFYALGQQTRLKFHHHTLAGSWEELTHHGSDIIIGAINEPPTSAAYCYKQLGSMENVFLISPIHPLAKETGPLTNQQICLHRTIVVSDSARYCAPITTNYFEEQEQIVVDDFPSKVSLLQAGLGCGFLPRHIAQPSIDDGSLVIKEVTSYRQYDVAYMAWRNDSVGLASRWWRDELLSEGFSAQIYAA